MTYAIFNGKDRITKWYLSYLEITVLRNALEGYYGELWSKFEGEYSVKSKFDLMSEV